MGTIRESVCRPRRVQAARHGRSYFGDHTPDVRHWWFSTDGMDLLDPGHSADPSFVEPSRPWYFASARCSNPPVCITSPCLDDPAVHGMDDRLVLETEPSSIYILFYNGEHAGAS